MTDDPIPYEQAHIIGGVEPSKSDLKSGFMFFDQLSTIFAGQLALMERYHTIEKDNFSFPIEAQDAGDLDSRLVQARMHELFGFLMRELGEAMQELRSKPWKQAWHNTDRDKFIEEMADSLHFFIEMCITSGIDDTQLFTAYFKAWGKNRGRQADGYSDSPVGESFGLGGDDRTGDSLN